MYFCHRFSFKISDEEDMLKRRIKTTPVQRSEPHGQHTPFKHTKQDGVSWSQNFVCHLSKHLKRNFVPSLLGPL